jgi:hypothetical protein
LQTIAQLQAQIAAILDHAGYGHTGHPQQKKD